MVKEKEGKKRERQWGGRKGGPKGRTQAGRQINCRTMFEKAGDYPLKLPNEKVYSLSFGVSKLNLYAFSNMAFSGKQNICS